MLVHLQIVAIQLQKLVEKTDQVVLAWVCLFRLAAQGLHGFD
jgi:hypothetical protein